MQEDIEEVSRVARQVKNRLERLDKINEQSLTRKVLPYTYLLSEDVCSDVRASRGVTAVPALERLSCLAACTLYQQG